MDARSLYEDAMSDDAVNGDNIPERRSASEAGASEGIGWQDTDSEGLLDGWQDAASSDDEDMVADGRACGWICRADASNGCTCRALLLVMHALEWCLEPRDACIGVVMVVGTTASFDAVERAKGFTVVKALHVHWQGHRSGSSRCYRGAHSFCLNA